MVMQCGVKRKHCCLGENSLDLERQQQSLLELSVHKLQEEQAKYGIEPRLLRFVLINNALRALQMHMMRFDVSDEFGLFDSQSQDSFLVNTFSHGLISSPVSPPTPVKVPRLDSSPFSSNSPLLNSCTIPSLGCTEVESEDFDIPLLSPLSPFPLDDKPHTNEGLTAGKRSTETRPSLSEDEVLENETKKNKSKKIRPNSLPISSNHSSSPSSKTEDLSSDESTSSLSPIDFANVDVSLYDFDARTALSFPPVAETPRNPTPSSLSISSCALETYINPLESNDTATESASASSSSGVSSGGTENGTGSSSNSSSPLSTDLSEVDNLDEIDRIVSLLMT